MNDGEAGDGHGRPTSDVEHPTDVIAADGELGGPRPLDVQVLADRQFPLRQGDRLAVELVAELDGVPRTGGGEERSQGASRAVVRGNQASFDTVTNPNPFNADQTVLVLRSAL